MAILYTFSSIYGYGNIFVLQMRATQLTVTCQYWPQFVYVYCSSSFLSLLSYGVHSAALVYVVLGRHSTHACTHTQEEVKNMFNSSTSLH